MSLERLLAEFRFDFPALLAERFPDREPGSGAVLGAGDGPWRRLRPSEIRRLERQGNSCADWRAVAVGPRFDCRTIVGNRFGGPCAIAGEPGAPLALPDGSSEPAGVYHSDLAGVEIAAGCAVNRSRLYRVVVARGAAVVSSAAVGAERQCFGNGAWADVGIETGGRSLPLALDLDLALAEWILRHPGHPDSETRLRAFFADYAARCARPYAIVDRGARAVGCRAIASSFLGAGAIAEGAELIEDSCLEGAARQAARVGPGCQVRRSLLQAGSAADSGALVADSLLFEHSHADQHAKVANCAIGPNSGVSKGEATASFLGPFVGFHHQSMLIAALWPQGRGNIAYGANVGSNHTSRMPDQEIWPGEGMFFGLGCTVKFPANFSASPYTVIAAGVSTLPQRLAFPFSLVGDPPGLPGVPPGCNNLSPAWGLSDNYYALKRNEGKFHARNRAERNRFDLGLFRPEILSLMQSALDSLLSVSAPKELYLPGDLPGIGKNVVTEANRLKAIAAYRFFLDLERCRASARNAGALAAEGRRDALRRDLKTLLELLPALSDKAESSRQRDYSRGVAIIDDYALTHAAADKDAFILQLRSDLAAESAAAQRLLDDLD